MAVLWQTLHDNVRYEVRSHGRTLRLYANGVQHSEHHPDRLVTGSVWDLLWLPGLLLPPGQVRSVLVLGLGGGSVIAPLYHLFAPERLVAVDMDALHVEVAQRFFGVGDYDVTCHCDDAVNFVSAYRGEPFDLVIEDLFAPEDRTVTRAVPATGRWFGQLSRLVSAEGALVMNFGERGEYRDAWVSGERALRGWQGRVGFSTADCHNIVVAWTRGRANTAAMRRRVREHPELSRELAQGRLGYRATRL